MDDRRVFGGLAFALFLLITVSVVYLFAMSKNVVDLAFAYVAGISMIILPCTLPLVFIIVPLSIGKNYKKGLIMALLFGLGLSITIAIYGAFVGLLGNLIGLDTAMNQAGLISKVFFMIGGLIAFVFGLVELNLLRFKLPTYLKTPKFIERRKDYSKAFFLGLFLGNAGVGCPNPLFYILLGDIAVKGSVLSGAWLGLIHGIGRATPLIFLSILGILGLNATNVLVKHRARINKALGWSLVFLGAGIFIMGGAHGWYEETIIHGGWNVLVGSFGLPAELGETAPQHEGPSDFIPGALAPWVFLAMLILPILWYKKKGDKNGKRPGM